MLRLVNILAQPVLRPVDLRLLLPTQLPAVRLAILPDLLVQPGFLMLQMRSLLGRQLAVLHALANTLLLPFLPALNLALRSHRRSAQQQSGGQKSRNQCSHLDLLYQFSEVMTFHCCKGKSEDQVAKSRVKIPSPETELIRFRHMNRTTMASNCSNARRTDALAGLCCLPQDEYRHIRLLKLRDSNGVTTNEFFHLSSPERTLLDSDYLWRKPVFLREPNEVSVCSDDRETVLSGVFPYGSIRRESRQACIKDMGEDGKQVRKPPQELWREIGIEQQLHREIRSRPKCDA